MLGFTLFLPFLGCSNKEVTTQEETISVDADGDGFTEDVDCNDADIQVSPEAMELCDGIDNNCDGNIDEEVTTTFYGDSDGDGFGNPIVTSSTCAVLEGWSENASDCEDTNPLIHPNADEVCDGIDS